MQTNNAVNWSFRLCQLSGLEIRVHWSCIVFVLLPLLWIANHGPAWYWLPVLVLIPFVSVLLHEIGHACMARLVGGDVTQITMWALGGLASYDIPATPGKRFAVAAAGPLVSFILYALCALSVHDRAVETEQVGMVIASLAVVAVWTASINGWLLVFNLLPAYPLDGGAMLRAALWPVLGLSRAVYTTIVIGYIVVFGLLVWAVVTGSIFLCAICFLLLFQIIREHVMLSHGVDMYLGMTPDYDPVGKPLMEVWRERRLARHQERNAAKHQEEQVLLDALLEKVSQQGLPSLTSQERAMLKRMSDEQKQRQ